MLILKLENNNLDALAKLHSTLRQEMILDSARKALFSKAKGNRINFYLHKQAAFAGHISFCQPKAESPLGPISIEITCDDPEALIDWLAPSTAKPLPAQEH